MQIHNRRELSEHLESRLQKTYKELKDDQKLESEHSFLKTHIVESNLPSVSKLPAIKGYTYNHKLTDDKTLHILDVIKNENGHKSSLNRFYIDSINTRFWVFHTIDKSNETDIFLRKLINKPVSGLDTLWFTKNYNETMSRSRGFNFRGFTLKYNDVFETEEDNIPINALSMRLWGNTANSVYGVLKNSPELKNNITLSGIGIKYSEEEDKDNFIIEDVNYQGKFTARGTSFDDHYFVYNKFRERYQDKIEKIESNMIFSETKGYGYSLEGQPLAIVLDKPIVDLKQFLEKLLSSSIPFRLWGLYNFINHDYAKVKVVDLHIGQQLDLELSPKLMRIYLPKGTCGNTVLRLLTNIQRYYDSNAVLEGINIGEGI